MRLAKVLIIILCVGFFWGCTKDSISPVPVIKFVKQNTNLVPDSGIGREDALVFQFDFEDGDADVGPLDIPTPWQNIHFIDQRDTTNILFFDFPPIPSAVVQDDGITGTFQVFMPANLLIARTDTTVHKTSDTVRWKVKVFDFNGNVSNTVLTDSVIIMK